MLSVVVSMLTSSELVLLLLLSPDDWQLVRVEAKRNRLKVESLKNVIKWVLELSFKDSKNSRLLWYGTKRQKLCSGTLAAGSSPSRAAKAVLIGLDLPIVEGLQIKGVQCLGSLFVHTNSQHLVKIAIIKAPVPVY